MLFHTYLMNLSPAMTVLRSQAECVISLSYHPALMLTSLTHDCLSFNDYFRDRHGIVMSWRCFIFSLISYLPVQNVCAIDRFTEEQRPFPGSYFQRARLHT